MRSKEAINTVDESAVVPTNKVTYARRFEKELLESLDMYLEDLVEFTVKEAKLGGIINVQSATVNGSAANPANAELSTDRIISGFSFCSNRKWSWRYVELKSFLVI